MKTIIHYIESLLILAAIFFSGFAFGRIKDEKQFKQLEFKLYSATDRLQQCQKIIWELRK